MRSKGDNAGKIIPATEKIQLDAGEEGEEGKRVKEGKGSRDSFPGRSVSSIFYKGEGEHTAYLKLIPQFRFTFSRPLRWRRYSASNCIG